MSDAAAEPPASAGAMTRDEALVLLTTGDLAIEGRLVDASNITLLATAALDGVTVDCVYKPIRGERSLWDFPDGTLAGREVATFLVDQATGWCQVPPTVYRDGPLGPGMCQLWVESEDISGLVDIVPQEARPDGWYTIVSGVDQLGQEVAVVHADDERLRRLAVLDAVVNNADRKGGHLLLTQAGSLYGVDHGICFHSDNKLRTLLWGWAGSELTVAELAAVARVRDQAPEALRNLLSASEIEALVRRADLLVSRRRLPRPHGAWPSIPWPPF